MLITDHIQCAGCINHGGDQFSCDFIKLHYQRCAGTIIVYDVSLTAGVADDMVSWDQTACYS